MLCYMEYAYVNVLTSFLSIALYSMMPKEAPEQITYLIFNIYCTLCLIISVIKIHKIYRIQQAVKSYE